MARRNRHDADLLSATLRADRKEIGQRCFRSIARAALVTRCSGAAAEEIDVSSASSAANTCSISEPPLILVAPFVGARCRQHPRLHRDEKVDLRANPARWDRWLKRGRERFNEPVLVTRQGSDAGALRAMKGGMPFYYLPDMDHGPANSIFVPFFGEPAATLPMVSRIARLIDAKVVMAVTEMTADGYVLHIEAPWAASPAHRSRPTPRA
jgi:KDO2-lipid IV(A) lauroyltransferase